MSEDNIQPIEVAAAPVEELAPAPEIIEAPQPEPIVVAVPEPEPIVVPEPTPEPAVAVIETPKPVKAKASSRSAAVSGKDKDDVFLANCVYKNVYSRKSLTVHHLQRRLTELGYVEANADKDGWLGDLTKAAITKFQKDKGLNATGQVDADTFTKIFEGDLNVNVNL